MADQWTCERMRSAVHDAGTLGWDPDVVADRTMAGRFVGLTSEGSAPVRWLAFRAPHLVALEVHDEHPIVVWDSAESGAVVLAESGKGAHRRLRARFTDHSAVGLRMDANDHARLLRAAGR